jgi:hypothetical protein
MAGILNAYGDCATLVGGTGYGSCDPKTMGDLLALSVFDKSVSFPITNGVATISESVIDGLIQDRKLHNLIDRKNFTQEVKESEIFTDGTGLESLVRAGKTKLMMEFANGLTNSQAIYSLRGDNRWNVALCFDKGVLFSRNIAGTKLLPIDTGLFDVSNVTFLQGTDLEKVKVSMQLKRVDDIMKYGTFITYEELGFNLASKMGVIDAVVTVTTPPTNLGTTMSVRAVFKGNQNTPISSLDLITYWATGGTQTTPKAAPTTVVLNATTGDYDMTFATAFATADTYQPRLRDSSKNVAKTAVGDFFAGQSELGTI